MTIKVFDHISWMSLMGGLDAREDLLSSGSAGVLVLGSTNTEPVSSWLADTGDVRGFGKSASLRELAGSSEMNFLKWDELRVTFRSPPWAVSILWFLLVTVNGIGWYGVESFPRFGCFTSGTMRGCSIIPKELIHLLPPACGGTEYLSKRFPKAFHLTICFWP